MRILALYCSRMPNETKDVAARHIATGMRIMTLSGLQSVVAVGLGRMAKTVLVQVESGRVITFKPNTTVRVHSEAA